jgi:hypothetical protein
VDILIRLKNFESRDAAEKVANAIGDAGGIAYIDKSSGDTVNVTVGDVTVDDSTNVST